MLLITTAGWFPTLTRAFGNNGRCPRQKLVFGIIITALQQLHITTADIAECYTVFLSMWIWTSVAIVNIFHIEPNRGQVNACAFCLSIRIYQMFFVCNVFVYVVLTLDYFLAKRRPSSPSSMHFETDFYLKSASLNDLVHATWLSVHGRYWSEPEKTIIVELWSVYWGHY